MSGTPLSTTGITGGISETGVATIEVPMFVDTLAEALSVLPNLGIGIPYRSRSFTQEDDGGFKVTLHFEGISNEAPSEDQVTFELDTSMAEDPIQTHPFFDTIKTRYAWDAAKEQFAETLPESSGEQTALSGSGKKAKKNPMFGVDNWLVVGAVFRKTYAAQTIPASILRGIGTIVDKPPGIEQFKIPGAAKKRNWLKMAPKIKRKGNAVEITEKYMLSGPNGWLRDVYGQAQLEGGSEWNDLPFVKRGQPITAALWNQLCGAVRANHLIAGNGVRLREMPDGTIITFDGGGAEFVHPFQVSFSGTDAVTIRPGTVNRVDATIKDVPLAGADNQPPPLLKFGQPMLDDEGRGYICVEVTCREKDWSVEKAEVVQVADPNADDGEAGEGTVGNGGAVALPGRRVRYPLAMLRERRDGKLDLYQIAFFDLQHRPALAPDRKTATRHFFWQ